MAATTAGPTSENDAPQDREHRAHLASGVKRRKVRRPGRVRRRCLPPGGQPPPIRAEPQRAEARAKMGEDGPLGGGRRIGDIPTITIPSALPDASSRPSGLNATATTVLPWPVMAAISAGCSGSMASHKITIRSAPPEASNCSSGLNATAHTALARRASVAIRPGGGGGGRPSCGVRSLPTARPAVTGTPGTYVTGEIPGMQATNQRERTRPRASHRATSRRAATPSRPHDNTSASPHAASLASPSPQNNPVPKARATRIPTSGGISLPARPTLLPGLPAFPCVFFPLNPALTNAASIRANTARAAPANIQSGVLSLTDPLQRT